MKEKTCMVKIYRGLEVILEIPVNEGARASFLLKTSDYIVLPFSLKEPIYFRPGDYVDLTNLFDGAEGSLLAKRYELTESQAPAYNENTGGYDYQLKFDAYYWKWKNKIFKYIPEQAGSETSWSLTASLNVHMGVFLRNLNALGYRYNGQDFLFSIDDTVENKAIPITYDNISLLDALFTMSGENAWNCDVWVTDNIIHFGRNEHGTAVKIERDVEAGNITIRDSKGVYGTRFFVFGSTRNISTNYRPADEQPVINGVVQKRLMLPSDTPYIDAYEGMTDDEAIEKVVVFDDVYPRRVGELSDVHTRTEEVTNEDGTKETVTYYRYEDSDLLFKENYILENETLKIKFQSGKMNGMEFEVIFNPEPKDSTRGEQLWEIVRNEKYGRFLPDDVIRPEDGDKYVLSGFNIQLVSDLYIPSAEKELLDKGKKYAQKAIKDDGTYQVSLRSSWVYSDRQTRFFDFGQRINLIDTAFFEEGRLSRILGYEIKLDIPWDTPVYTVGESMPYSRIEEIENKIDALTYKGQTYTGEGETGMYIIRTNDNTKATNDNVYSALRSKLEFLSKLNNDTANGIITFLNGTKWGNFTSETGAAMSVDPVTGQTYMEVDRLKVRLKAFFEQLEVQKVGYVGGKLVVTKGQGVNVLDVENVYGSDGSLSAYRCYFLGEQEGRKIDNLLRAGDQMICNDFNISAGTHDGAMNKYYWRLVTDVSTDTVKRGNNVCHWVDLSATDRDTGSDIPAAGDTICHLGNRTDTDRQGAIILSVTDVNSPSFTIYAGINSYSLVDKEYIDMGVAGGKAYSNIYGDHYVGDRKTSADRKGYMEWDDDAKEMYIKGKLSIGSKIGDDTFEEYIKKVSPPVEQEDIEQFVNNIVDPKLEGIQNQIDGVIETWFYNGVPTLTNFPASGWNTDALKIQHLGDLYYDNDTGTAYRFSKSEQGAYYWNVITDDAITKALAAAQKAQDTADGKRRVFTSQPTVQQEYDAGDLWVNATYGTQYSNDLLRCVTHKDASTAFNIEHWTLASKYTDDSALNAFISGYQQTIADIKTQVDGKAETWRQATDPSSAWTTAELKAEHKGDLWYNTTDNTTWYWSGTKWEPQDVPDSVFDAIDGKADIFVSKPASGYKKNDLWFLESDYTLSGVAYKQGTLVVAKNDMGAAWSANDWTKKDRYTDDSALDAFKTAYQQTINAINQQIDKKAETWYQSADPAASWTTAELKAEHVGDLWYNTTTGKTYYYNGTAWQYQDIPQEVFDKIDGKATIFVSKPTSYLKNDLWILEAAYTLSGVAYTKGELVTATADSSTFNAAHWTKKVKYTDDTLAQAAKDAADNAQTAVTTLSNSVNDLRELSDTVLRDGVVTEAEKAAVQKSLSDLATVMADVDGTYGEITKNAVYGSINAATRNSFTAAYEALTDNNNGAYVELVTAINNVINATTVTDALLSELNTKYDNFNLKYKDYNKYLTAVTNAIDDILNTKVGDLVTMLGGLSATTDAMDESTTVQGGLILSTLLALGYTDTGGAFTVRSGVSGLNETTAPGGGIAFWAGGSRIDIESCTKNADGTYSIGGKVVDPADYLVRHDGTGYMAGGAIKFDADGKIHADPQSFLISEQYVGNIMQLFQLNYGVAGSSKFDDVVSATPQKMFTNLTLGSDGLTVTDGVHTSKLKMSDGVLFIEGNLAVTGGITMYASSGITSNIMDAILVDGTTIGKKADGTLYVINEGIVGTVTGIKVGTVAYSPDADGIISIPAYPTALKNPNALTIQKNGTSLGSYDGSSVKTINISDVASAATLSSHTGNTTVHITAAERTKWNKVVTDFAAITGEDTDTIINKWEEVVAFLDTYTEADTLAGLLGNKVDKVSGKGLSTNDFTTALLNKLNGIEAGANKYVLPMASSTVLGGIKVGTRLSIDTNGVLSATYTYTLPTASDTTKGGVKVGGTLAIASEVLNLKSGIVTADTYTKVTVDTYGRVTAGETLAAADIPSLDWSKITTGKPTTIAGYGITNAYTKTEVNTKLGDGSVTKVGTVDVGSATKPIYLKAGVPTAVGSSLGVDITGNAASASKLQTARTIWGQSFNGTGNVSGNMTGVGSITASGLASVGSLSVSGISVTKSAAGILKIDGNLIVTGGITMYASDGVVSGIMDQILVDGTTIKKKADGTLYADVSVIGGGTVKGATVGGSAVTLGSDGILAFAAYPTLSSLGASASNHTHSVKINGATKTIAASGGAAVDLGTYLTAHQTIYDLTIQGNGTAIGTFDPNGAAKTINITPANIGAAAASHAHSYLPLSGGTLTGSLLFSNSGTTLRGMQGTMGDNDQWRVMGGATASNAGFLEIATSDDGNEPIYVRQFNKGVFGTLVHSITLMDGSGNQTFNTVTAAALKKSGGTSSQFLKADGSVDSNTYLTTGMASSTYVKKSGDTMTGTLTVSTIGTNNYNQGIRINRTALTNWATLTIGYVGVETLGASAYTWLIGTPANSNSLIFNHNNASETVGLCLKGHGNTDMKWNNNTIWHAGNDGSGSGLDADLLDGVHASKFPYINNTGIWRVYGNAAAAALADNTAGLSAWAFGETRSSSRTYLGILKPSAATCGISVHGTIAVFGQGDTHMGLAVDYGSANLQVFGGNADKIVWRKSVAFTDSTVANSDKCDGLHVHGGRNNEANKIVRTDGNGFLQVGYINSSNGNEGNNSSPARVWGTNGSDNYMRTYLTSALAVYSATRLATARSIFGKSFDGTSNVAGQGLFYGSYNSTVHDRYRTSGLQIRENGLVTNSQSDIAYAPSIGFHWASRIAATMLFHSDGNFYLRKQDGVTRASLDANIIGNAATATKLTTARTINGTSFDGTANITTANWGTARNIYIADATAAHTGAAVSVNGSGNATLKLPATITAALVGNASSASKWATARTLTLSGSVTGSASIDGSGNVTLATTTNHTHAYLPLAGGTMTANSRISHEDGNMYLGRADNKGWIMCQDICSQTAAEDSYWSLRTNGTLHAVSGVFSSGLTTSGNIAISGTVDIGSVSSSVRYIYSVGLWSGSGSTLTLGANDANMMRFLTNGNVGIGTLSPTCKFHVGGDILASGGITMYSDLRKKNVLSDEVLSVKEIAQAPLFRHTYKDDRNNYLHIGTSAQYWSAIHNNWFTRKDDEGYYQMELQNLGVAMGISLAREIVKYESKTDKKIRLMRNRIKELETKVAELERRVA